MDPLSVSASVASLIGITEVVARRLYTYGKGVKGAEKEITVLSKEITGLYGILNSLHLVAERLANEVSELPLGERSMQIEHVHACYSTMHCLDASLKRDDPSTASSGIESVKRWLHWPFSEARTKSLVDEVGRHKQTLALALNADTMAALLRSLSQQREMSNNVHDIRNRMIANSINDIRRKVIGSYAQKLEHRKGLSAALKLRQLGTGSWICKNPQFQAWISGNRAKLFLTGIPGAGKTILTATMIEEVDKHILRAPKSSALAYCFCDYKDPATHEAQSLIGSLIGQFAVQNETCYSRAYALYEEHHPTNGSVSSYTKEEVKQCLLDMIKTLDHAYIIIDALDECMNDRVSFLEALHDLNDFKNDNIKTLFTGRDEMDIQRALHDYDKLSIAANSHDIRLFVDSQIVRRSKNGSLNIKDPEFQDEIRERLVDGARGMFRWVACQMDHICTLHTNKSRRKALDTLPPDLPTTYERILDRVNANNKETQVIVQRTLRWILWAVEPLPLPALAEAVSIDFGDRELDTDAIVDSEAILQWCGSLLRKDPATYTVELAHYWVKEFLEGMDRNASSKYLYYRVNVMDDALELAMTCLTYLCFDNFDINQPDDPQKVKILLDEYKFLRYCVQYWQKHARITVSDSSLMKQMQSFLNLDRTNQFITWMSCLAFIAAREPEEVDIGKSTNNKGTAEMARMLSQMADSSPLHWAAASCLPSMCQWLIAKGCGVHQYSGFFGEPLFSAVSNTYIIVPNGKIEGTTLARKITSHCTYETVKVLLDQGADCNATQQYEGTETATSILHEAIVESEYEVAQLLLDSGSLCDRACIDLLAKGDGECFNLFRNLKDDNIENGQVDHYLKVAASLDVGWDRVLGSRKMAAPSHTLSSVKPIPLLFNAAKFGRLQVMKEIIKELRKPEHGKGLNEVNEKNETALHMTCYSNHSEILEVLLKEGVSLNEVDSKGRSPLFIAVENESHDCARLLLQYGADVRLANSVGSTTLHAAALLKTRRMLDMIIGSPKSRETSVYSRNKDGCTLLHNAAYVGSLPVIQGVLEYFPEASLDERLPNGSSCLHLAACSGSLPAANFFLDGGLIANDVNKFGRTPVFHAVQNHESSTAMVKLLHARGADLTIADVGGDIPVFAQIQEFQSFSNENALDCFHYLLENTTDIDHCDKEGNNALHILIKALPRSLVKNYIERACLALLHRKCSLAKRNVQGSSPFEDLIERWGKISFEFPGFFTEIFDNSCLEFEGKDEDNERENISEYAGYRSPIGMIMFILKYTAASADALGPPDDIQCWGAGLLSFAVRTRDSDVIRAVFEYDQNVDRKDATPVIQGHSLLTPLEWMCTSSFADIKLIRDFLSCSRSVNQLSNYGDAPIHIASAWGSIHVLEELLAMGVDPESSTSEGITPLMYAIKEQSPQAMRLLYKHGARTVFRRNFDVLKAVCRMKNKAVFSTLVDMPDLSLDWRRTFERTLEDHTEVNNMTYFHYAACFGNWEILEWFWNAGLMQNIDQTVGNFTALWLAARYAHHETVFFLLSKGADCSLRCGVYQRTSLHIAAAKGDIQCIRTLLTYGADISARDLKYCTPELLAICRGRHEAAEYLREHYLACDSGS